jgi:predicted nucleotidyltransferase
MARQYGRLLFLGEKVHAIDCATAHVPATNDRATAMRLTPSQSQLIIATVRQQLGAQAKISLFGSRLDDAAKGGDVDILVENDQQTSLLERARIKMVLEDLLLLPVDVVTIKRGAQPTAFQRIAMAKAIALREG